MNENPPEKIKKKKDLAYRFGEFVGILILFLIVFIFLKLITWGYGLASPYYGHTNKQLITRTISSAVQNEADLNVIKTIFNNRDINKTLRSRWFSNNSDYYDEPITLARVLNDMRAQYFLSDDTDENYLINLSSLIRENNELNPFDKLQSYQKDYFTNIRLKLGGNYALIENDIINISEDLDVQNQLVQEYLSDATTGLVISMSGLIFALTVSIYQMFIYRKRRKEEDNRYFYLLNEIDENNKKQKGQS